ncbi:aldo/keto reductase [Lentilactobacillus kefiri]|uniref:2,5-didehydrogluconate reductase n=2 Tax=Lentilactobacillus kefiri TaxID=33962 RepID=A0A8E1RGN6_LENKE|nr:aldo/keto reductase [Lentilactobacillus kefiri]KRL73656.1 2,5-didehydrogluconate reductase [Lentilactobacillus parakefiri DSM 10551]KRM49759.1 2,5-didehydrogluconate reductase [Lentilactobacillus kefiri DSM 20587 = JCM 5818]MCJ2161599.1 aldo/keto reductase [Lentilactobacillus kefiri]MCP9368188.1 aldo/keto reductase [Lentilactobacillus kefiri]MDH5108254.1 aldo/keto reductase [Lentilactobacillus kefiri]
MANEAIPEITLNDGYKMAKVQFGTFGIRGGEGLQQTMAAISDGYRGLDTATNYDNEGMVGEAIRRSGIPRSEFFVTSKLPGKYHRYDEATKAIQESLYRLGLDYFDLFLIHWPLPKRDHYVEAFQAMIDAKKRGLIRSVGVSNFEPEHLDRLINETGVTPAVNQIEVHPYWNNERMLEEDKKRGIVTEAWSPLGRGSAALKEPIIQELANKYGKNVGQIIIRWHTQRGIIPVPRSTNLVHQRANKDIFDFKLTDEEIKAINALSKPDGRVDGQDPNVYEEFD